MRHHHKKSKAGNIVPKDEIYSEVVKAGKGMPRMKDVELPTIHVNDLALQVVGRDPRYTDYSRQMTSIRTNFLKKRIKSQHELDTICKQMEAAWKIKLQEFRDEAMYKLTQTQKAYDDIKAKREQK